MPMNTANKLTLARVFMIPLFLVIVYWGFPGSRYVALGGVHSGLPDGPAGRVCGPAL